MASGNDPANIPYIIVENGFYYVAYKEKVKVPEIVVSSKGIANGLSEEYNDGWDFGPDSYSPTSTSAIPYTQTSGIYEASNYAAGGFNQAGYGKVVLETGTYDVHTLIYIWENVSLDGQGSVINFYGDENDFYTGYPPAELFLIQSTQGYYTGKVSNLIVNVQSTATQLINVLNGVTARKSVIYENITVNCNSIAPVGLSFNAASNCIARDIYIDLPTNTGVLFTESNGITGTIIEDVSVNSGTQGNSVNGITIKASDGDIKVIGGRIMGGNAGILFDSTDYTIDGAYIIQTEFDATSNTFSFNQVTNSMAKIGFFDVISTDPSGRHFNLVAGSPTGIFRSGGIYIGASVSDNVPITNYIVAPTLSANPPASGTVYQNTNPYNIEIDLPAYATTSGTAGYVTVAKGATSTPTAIGNQYVSGDTSDTSEQIIRLRVPAGWYYEFTASGVTFGTASVFAD